MPKASLQYPSQFFRNSPVQTISGRVRSFAATRLARLEKQEKTLIRAGYAADDPLRTHIQEKKQTVSSEMSRLRSQLHQPEVEKEEPR